MQPIDASKLDLKEKVVAINRVAKVVKGGRNFRFTAIGWRHERHVGCTGKSVEIPNKKVLRMPRRI